jgi:hypothetical protein
MSLFAAMSHPVPLLTVSVRIVVGRLLCLVPSSPSSSCLPLLAVRIHLSVSPPRQTKCSMEAETLDSFSIRLRLSGCRDPALPLLSFSVISAAGGSAAGDHGYPLCKKPHFFVYGIFRAHGPKEFRSRVLETWRSLALALRGAQIAGEPWRKRTVRFL